MDEELPDRDKLVANLRRELEAMDIFCAEVIPDACSCTWARHFGPEVSLWTMQKRDGLCRIHRRVIVDDIED